MSASAPQGIIMHHVFYIVERRLMLYFVFFKGHYEEHMYSLHSVVVSNLMSVQQSCLASALCWSLAHSSDAR